MTNGYRLPWPFLLLSLALVSATSAGCAPTEISDLEDATPTPAPDPDSPDDGGPDDDVSQAPAWGTPQRVTINGYTGDIAGEPFFSAVDQFLFFNDGYDPADPAKPGNLYYATRVSETEFDLVGDIGVAAAGAPTMDTTGDLYWLGLGNCTYRGTFQGGTVTGTSCVMVTGTPYNPVQDTFPDGLYSDVGVSFDGTTLIYNGDGTLEIASKNADGTFSQLSNSAALMANVNNGNGHYAPAISADLLELFFSSMNGIAEAPGNYTATREAVTEPFGAPQPIPGTINLNCEGPAPSYDGTRLYFHKGTVIDGVGTTEVWMMVRE